jgi:Ca-activated chloride channel homolog
MHYSLLFLASLSIPLWLTFSGKQSASPNEKITAALAGDKKVVDWHVKPGNNWVYQNSSGDCYLYINIKSGEGEANKPRVPLNISLVLDRSGSMSGDKIKYARQAAKFLIDQLNSADYLSIVNYDDRVEVTSPSQLVKNKEALKSAIDKIGDRGSTNLSGGMLEGYTQVKSTRKEGFVNRVLLLTDGLANQGITDPKELKRLAENKYKEEGIALSTFGVGADYNEDLLTMLAETGRANYYFIDSPDKIPQIFAGELKGLLSVVAQNAWAEVTIPQDLECTNVYGYPYEVKNGKVMIRFNDLYANDEKAILIKLKSKGTYTSNLRFDCTLGYTDAATFEQVKEGKPVQIKMTTDQALIKAGEEKDVQEMLALFESTENFDDIMSDVDKGEYEVARQKGEKAVRVLKEKQVRYNSPKLEEQVKKMSSYVAQMDSVKVMRQSEKSMYQKMNKSVNYNVKKMKDVEVRE